MTRSEIAQQRLQTQHLVSPKLTRPVDVVKWFGAMQAQDYAGAKWSLAQRMTGATDADIEGAFTRGEILRTHLMRGTWHFVAPSDIRWVLALTAPRQRIALASYSRKMGLDAAEVRKSNKTMTRALRGGRQLTREALRDALHRNGIAADGLRFIFLLAYAELDAVICSGAREGKQFTYTLLDDRVPETKPLARDKALAELAWRYVRSHGPATLADFVWWSGLTTGDARTAIAMVAKRLASFESDGKTYWMASDAEPAGEPSTTAYLLPTYDEFLIAYKDRSASIDHERSSDMRLNPQLISHLMIGGQRIGAWKRSMTKASTTIELDSYSPIRKKEKRAIAEAASKFGAFLGAQKLVISDW